MNIVEYLQSEKTRNSIVELIWSNRVQYHIFENVDKMRSAAAHSYNYFISQCVHNNQYISFTDLAIRHIKSIYDDLFRTIARLNLRSSIAEVEKIVIDHRAKLIAELKLCVQADDYKIQHALCSEYSGDFQWQILRLDEQKLIEPILDVGCGEKNHLVKQLRLAGYVDVFGVDQYANSDRSIICGNWLDLKFKKGTFGAIIAHMSFSNHFARQIFLGSAKQSIYAQKYHEILESLKEGGRFMYTPALEKIESDVDLNRFDIKYYSNTCDRNLDTVHVVKV
ncbi:class I SAM-dependent methyltransferase [Desulfovibrio sp. Huiquan2017]|uniref:class I SAM-dependent methyltransferase n=1 Tax=Desulfovibrio sp. Huiquan2017 TaxID=2816861 RepID=UPI001A92CB71|nr:class I SAM-dependent methyltransferase [Desulfovibrio sp. Huiquan2017]